MSFWSRIPRHTDLPDLRDESLCREVGAGNHEAFLVLFDRYWQPVSRLAYAVLRDEAEAEDLAQSLFFEVHKNLLRFDPGKGSFRTLLFRYAYTRAIDQRRRLERGRFYSHVQLEDAPISFLANDSSPFMGLFLEEGAQLIQQVMKHLDEKQRETVEAYFFHGVPLIEIAQKQNDSLGNVRHHLYRGLGKMRKLLAVEVHTEDSSAAGQKAGAKSRRKAPKQVSTEVSIVRARSI